MKRYKAFDPPEYQDWTLDPDLLAEYQARVSEDEEENAYLASVSDEWFLELYRDLLRNRLLDVGLKRWVRQGVISKAWLGTGEEAVTVGAVSALDRDRDVVTPMIRNVAACFMMGMPLADLFRGYLATADAPGGGRDLHVGAPEMGVIQPISHMGTNIPVMTGIAMAFRIRGEDRVAVTFLGDGASRTGEAHEGLNLAAVRNAPVVFVVQDNQVALGTPRESHGLGDMKDWPAMYGIPSRTVDGNNLVEMHLAMREAVGACRLGEGPRAIVARTFRMGGHATHDEREARDTFADELFRQWGKRDPVGLYEAWLESRGIGRDLLEDIEAQVLAEVDAAAEEALGSRDLLPDGEAAAYDGFTEGDTMIGFSTRPVNPGA
jgi:TPP-dependent pyruvate/acetoin dehydrogenase alpha subunit